MEKKSTAGPKKTASPTKKSPSSRDIPRSFRGVKRQNHMLHIEAKLQAIIDVNPYQFSEWQASYALWKTAFQRLVTAGLLTDQTEGPHRLKSLVNRQVDAYKTKMEKRMRSCANELLFPATQKDHLLQVCCIKQLSRPQ